MPFAAWKTLTFVAALRCDRMTAPMMLKEGINGEVFLAYVEQCLVPALNCGDFAVMGNVPWHKIEGVQDVIKIVGASLRYLPPYFSDLNPIEKVYGAFKTFPCATALSAAKTPWFVALGSSCDDCPPRLAPISSPTPDMQHDRNPFILAQYHLGQTTVSRLAELLEAPGVTISKRQIVRILTQGKDSFIAEARAVLRAGLGHGGWIPVDDTGARHKGRNGYCTQVGNDHFGFSPPRLQEPARLHASKARLLRVLDHPDVPLHNNGSERDIRCQVARRKISGTTRSDKGRDCRDAFRGLMKTCRKLGISFRDYPGARLGAAPAGTVPNLADVVISHSTA